MPVGVNQRKSDIWEDMVQKIKETS